MNVLELRGVCKQFKEFSLKDVTMALPKGYIMGFIGQNGAGKTTTIKLILNMMKRGAGSIEVFGRDNIAEEDAIKQDVGVVFDSPYYVEDWTVREVETAVRPFYSRWDSAAFGEYCRQFNLSATKKLKDLSRGMKMKLMLAVALSHGAKLLILDEPTSGLDPVARDELLTILYDYIADGEKSVLFSTHITADLEKIADYIAFIRDGEIVFCGAKDDLLESYVLVRGGAGDLTAAQRKTVIGLRENSLGFEGLMKAADLRGVSSAVTTGPVTLDEFIVFLSKGGSMSHE